MSSAQKDIIYIDVDDEITSVIDKVRRSKHKIIALVLPKRASMLKSVVNMKLLKRSSEEADKNIVLITSEAGLLPIAGAVGVHTAKTLQSKPTIPSAPLFEEIADGDNSSVSSDGQLTDAPIDKTKPIGELAGLPDDEVDDVIEVEDEQKGESLDKKKNSKKSNKKLKVPNFNKFRLWLIAGSVLFIGLIVFWFFALKIWPSANIVIKTESSKFDKEVVVLANPDAKDVDLDKSIIPAKVEELRKTDTEKVPATGEKNLGEKAKGSLTLTNCIDDGKKHTIPAGTSFSRDNKIFVTTAAIELGKALYSVGKCDTDNSGSADVAVTASEGGASYNIAAGNYNSSIAGINAYGSAMTGGTDKIVKVVSSQDVDNAKQKIIQRNSSGAAEELELKLKNQNYRALKETLVEGTPTISSSPEVGTEASEVTVTSTIIYNMTGVNDEGLKKIIEKSIEDKIDTAKQSVIDSGLDDAVIRVSDKQPNGQVKLTIQTIITTGPKIDLEALKKEIAGKKRGETQNIIQNRPGVKEVIVDYSPFWVFSTPTKTSKISITLEGISNNNDLDGESNGASNNNQ